MAIADHKETASVAEGALSQEYLQSYVGRSGTIRTTGANRVDVVSGATATSKAITSGVNRALAIVADLGDAQLIENEESESD